MFLLSFYFRKVVVLEKKEEEAFGFEIQVSLEWYLGGWSGFLNFSSATFTIRHYLCPHMIKPKWQKLVHLVLCRKGHTSVNTSINPLMLIPWLWRCFYLYFFSQHLYFEQCGLFTCLPCNTCPALPCSADRNFSLLTSVCLWSHSCALKLPTSQYRLCCSDLIL